MKLPLATKLTCLYKKVIAITVTEQGFADCLQDNLVAAILGCFCPFDVCL